MTMMNGIETLTIIHKHSIENPIKLYLSSSDDTLLKDSNLTFITSLTKPVSKNDIKSKLILNK